MDWNGKRMVGRFVVDIDGCLRSTDREWLQVSDLAALHGRLDKGTGFVMEIDGELIPLDKGDEVALSEARVAFFRSVRRSVFLRMPVASRPFVERTALAA